MVKNPSANAGAAGDVVLISVSGRSHGGGNGNLPQYLAWKTPWTNEPGGQQSMGLQRFRHN